MWLGFKKCWLIIFVMLASNASNAQQQAEGVIYNLKQNWVQYDKDAESFLPVISQTSARSISFQIEGTQYGSQLLFIKNVSKVYLFNDNVLIAELSEGSHYFNIDSLLRLVNSTNPILSIYGEDIGSNLLTYVVTQSFQYQLEDVAESHFRNRSFTSFFVMASIALLAGLSLIKFNSNDLFSQYSSVSRVFNLNTIDEIIYKGRFFVNPGIQMIAWMSASGALILYYLISKLNIHFLDISWLNTGTFTHHLVYTIILSFAFILLFVTRYIIVSIVAAIFDLSSTKNVHFASHLRLTFYLLLVLQFIVTLDYFSIIVFSRVLFLTIIFGSLLSIIVLIGIRLSFIVRHTFIQLFLYLCGTEIFLFVFVYKLVVG